MPLNRRPPPPARRSTDGPSFPGLRVARRPAPKEDDMNAASRPTLLVLLGLLTACQCENGGDVVGSSTGTTSNGESSSSASESMTSTGFPFDASRFIGRYHYV